MSDNYAVLTSNGTTTAIFRATDVGGGILAAMSIPTNASGTAMLGQATMVSSLPVVIASNQSNLPTNFVQVGGVALGFGQAVMATSLPVAIASNQSNVPFNLAAVGNTTFTLGQAIMATSIPVAIASNQSNVPFNMAAVGGTTFTLGQAVMATSIPVAIASNQSNVPFNLAAVGGTTYSLGQKVSATSISVVFASDAVFTTVITPVIPSIVRVAATAGSPAAVSVKVTSGTLKSVNLFCNNTAAPVYLKVYNFTAGAVNSSITPLFTIGVPPGDARDVPLGDGAAFTNALAYWITALPLDNDTTAVAINDLQGIITFV